MLESKLLFRMMANITSTTEAGGNVCLDIGVDLGTDHEEDEPDAETKPKKLLDLLG